MRYKDILLFFFSVLPIYISAQTIVITGNNIICNGQSTTLHAETSGTSPGTTSYTFEFIDFLTHPLFSGGTSIDQDFTGCTSGGHDDCWAGGPPPLHSGYDIGFTFCFFNQNYTKFYVGSNGWIGFTDPTGHQWTTYVATRIPSIVETVPKNCIFAPWQDWYPGASGTGNNVFYYTSGTAPSRKLVVYWTNCPLFNCQAAGGAYRGTFMIVLNEENSSIENFIQAKPNCASSSEGSTQGVLNSDGSIAFTATGRNYQVWQAFDEGTRFSPSGIIWYKDAYPGGTIVGYGSDITLSPATTTQYYAVTGTCNGGSASDNLTVIVNPLPLPTISGPVSECIGVTSVAYSTESSLTGYTWTISPGGLITSGAGTDAIAVSWNTAGTQNVSVNYTDANGCRAAAATVKIVEVHSLPLPSIAGSASVCAGVTGVTYSTESAMTGYTWTISPGGIISSGSGTNSVTANWFTAGAQSISVNYADANGCMAATATIKNVTVNPLPLPAIAGSASVCIGSAGLIYSTESSMTGYTWTISSGGIITAGAGTNTITVTWNTAGAQTLSVNYVDANGCTAATATVKNVTINTLPIPVIAGSSSVCEGSTGVTYSSEAAMTGYIWNVSPGGNITSGAGTDAVTVSWNTAGAQTVSVSYTDANGCTAGTPTIKNVTVNTLPIPTITGSASACAGTSGLSYSTEASMTGYTWAISPGGIITSGGGTNTITVNWNTAGTQNISVNYTDANGCRAASSAVKNITINTLPVPVITGSSPVCVGTSGLVYSTEPSMTGYSWNISPGGLITSGGGTNAITVNWNTAGAQNISVNYTDANGCTAVTATVKNVTVNTLPIPAIAGFTSVCAGVTGVSYSTEPSMTGYTWTVSPGGSITSGAGTKTITVSWNTPDIQTVSVNYTNANGCTAVSATQKSVTVNPQPVPTITGSASVCIGVSGVAYSTESAMTAYTWAVSAGGNISSGTGTNAITVSWNTAGPQNISVNYTNANGCLASSATVRNVTVNPLPITTISTGPGPDCGLQDHLYFTPPDPACIFTWSASSGTVASGQGTDQARINWSAPVSGPAPATVFVSGTNTLTSCSSSSSISTAVFPSPVPTLTPCFDLVTTKNAQSFILKGGVPLPGQYQGSPGITYDAISGNYWFNPSSAAVTQGSHQITYFVQNSYGCSKTTSAVIISVGPSNLTFTCGTDFIDPRNSDAATNRYPTATFIGNGRSKCWMLKNFNRGDVIPSIQPQTDNCTIEKYCLPADVTCSTYGALYQWDELIQFSSTAGPAYQGVCPPGWHLPSQQEWQDLIDFAAGLPPGVTGDGLAGFFLKDPWQANGFHALLDGIIYLNDLPPAFSSGSLTATMLWTSTTSSAVKAIARGINTLSPSVQFYPSSRANAFPVRCVKD